MPPLEAVLSVGVGLAVGMLLAACLGFLIVRTLRRGGGGRFFQLVLELALAWSGSALGVLFMFVGAYVGLGSGLYLAHALSKNKGTVRALITGTVAGSVFAGLLAWSLPWSWYTAVDIAGNMESSLVLAVAAVVPTPIAVAFYELSKGASARS